MEQVLSTKEDVARMAVRLAAQDLEASVQAHGRAAWVLAGGTTPVFAYAEMADLHGSDQFWQDVTLVMGDERLVPLASSDSNWGEFERATSGRLKVGNPLVPPVSMELVDAADRYQSQIRELIPEGSSGPRFDHVWLGMGEDGHALSLFPGRPEVDVMNRLVLGIDESPKPPPRRITLSRASFANVGHCVVMVTGQGKADALADALAPGSDLPVAVIASFIESCGGRVSWLIDEDAAARIR